MGSRVRIFMSCLVVAVLTLICSILTPILPIPSLLSRITTEKLDKEKNRYLELEKTNESQIVVIEKLSEEYQDVSTQLTELRLTLSHHQTNNEQWETEKADILHKHTIRIHELQTEINDLINTQTNQEEEYKCAMDDMEQLNVENSEYLEKIQEYEKRVVELEEQESEFEASRVKFR